MPNWYDKNLKKHWKDYGAKDYGNKILNMWHISPEKIVYPAAKSSFEGVAGMYFSPTYKSLIFDWAMYVAGKRQTQDGIERTFRSLFDMSDKIENEYESGKRQGDINSDQEYIKLNEKIDRLRETRERQEYQDAHRPYKFLYINKFIFPEWAYKEINEWFFGNMEEDEVGIGDKTVKMPKNIGFWAWGDQVFIPQNYFKYVKFISSKKMSLEEIVELKNKM